MLLCLFTYCSQPLRWQALTLWWRHQCSLQRSRLEKSLFGVFIQLKIGNALYAQKLFGYVLYGFSGIELVYFEHICFVSIQGCFKRRRIQSRNKQNCSLKFYIPIYLFSRINLGWWVGTLDRSERCGTLTLWNYDEIKPLHVEVKTKNTIYCVSTYFSILGAWSLRNFFHF